MWSLLVESNRWNTVHGTGNTHGETIERVLLMTGLGTGYGQISAVCCAEQMMLAVKHFAQGVPEDVNWENVDSLIKEVNASLSCMKARIYVVVLIQSQCHDSEGRRM